MSFGGSSTVSASTSDVMEAGWRATDVVSVELGEVAATRHLVDDEVDIGVAEADTSANS